MAIVSERLLTTAASLSIAEEKLETSIRPSYLADYTGQPQVVDQMAIFIKAAKTRLEALDHVLITGPPGLGKTTLAYIVAKEMGAKIKITSGPILEKAGDLAALLSHLEARDILFIDEIHRLSPVIEEILYPALEDYQLDLLVGEGPGARSIRLDLPPFTLIGATTRIGLLTSPLRDRFGIIQHLDFYKPEDLARIIRRSAALLKIPIDEQGALVIAERARGTPRIANRWLRRVWDVAMIKGNGCIDQALAEKALSLLAIDEQGLDQQDRRFLSILLNYFQGGPVGLESLAVALGEARDTLEEVIEPFLIQQGLIMRTSRGRVATLKSWKYFGLIPPSA